MRSPDSKPPLDRRNFFKKTLALVLGGVAALVPAVAGLLVALDPLRHKAAGGTIIRITTLDALPADGLPRRFPVIAARSDAWNRFQAAPIGAVYLRRTADDRVEALNVVCPHAGCFVEFAAAAGNFRCPCHQSTFALDGSIASPGSPSPRGLDHLAVKVGDDGAVWVTFQNFQSGRADQVPVS